MGRKDTNEIPVWAGKAFFEFDLLAGLSCVLRGLL